MKPLVTVSLLLGLTAGSCTTSRPPAYPGEFPGSPAPSERKGESEGKTYPFNALKIPPGHLPPPGECKIWIPGKPPGHQGPPQSCASAIANAPLGAWVITHEGSRYKVNVYNKSHRFVVDETRYYEVGNGKAKGKDKDKSKGKGKGKKG